jgi:hypothetical protein
MGTRENRNTDHSRSRWMADLLAMLPGGRRLTEQAGGTGKPPGSSGAPPAAPATGDLPRSTGKSSTSLSSPEVDVWVKGRDRRPCQRSPMSPGPELSE